MARQRAAAAGASSLVKHALFIASLLASALFSVAASAQGFSNSEILGVPAGIELESIRVRFTHFDQTGRGYQSQADRPNLHRPGSEDTTIEQPQLEIVAKQGKATHRLSVPVDIITAASPDALDAVSTASRVNEAGNFQLDTRYQQDRRTAWLFHANFHLEEPFRSWTLGVGGAHAFAEDNTVFAWSLNQVVDWLDRFNIFGTRLGRGYRSTTNLNVSLTQLLSPTTVGYVGYSFTFQTGELGNTWNSIAVDMGNDKIELDGEKLPSVRHRHALVARLSQSLPWDGILKLSYRFYVDSWSLIGNTIEAQLYQRVGRHLYVRANYRFHHQTGVGFFTAIADVAAPLRTADSDLAPFVAHTVGGLIAVNLKAPRLRDLHLDFGYERYFRSNDLSVNIYTCAMGFLF